MTKKIIIAAAALLVFAAAFVLKEKDGRELAAEAVPTEAATVALPRLVDLGSDKCIPCKQMAPLLEELRTEYQGSLNVEFIDVWKDPDAGKPFGIRVIPTQVFIDASGEERFRHEGFLGKEAILEKWKELGVVLTPQSRGPGA